MEFDLFYREIPPSAQTQNCLVCKQMKNTVKGAYWKCDTTLVEDLCLQLYGQLGGASTNLQTKPRSWMLNVIPPSQAANQITI